MRVAGVDEAGRGCLIGPLVVAGVLFRDTDIPTLRAMGVRDSKKLTPRRRETLSEEVKRLALDVRLFHLTPRSIDIVVERNPKLRKLNYLEAMAMANVIRELAPEEAYVDASDVNPARFGDSILRVLREKPRLVSEHKADSRYPVVSAASIVAKVHRDAIVAELREKHGDLGSGYPSDERTMRWLDGWLRAHGDRADFIRYSWRPVKDRLRRAA